MAREYKQSDARTFLATAIIVDDMPAIREVLNRILVSINIDVLAQAASVAHAIAMCEQLKPSLVCLDIGLPDGSGLELLAKIKRALPNTGVVIISGDSHREIVLAAMRAGADDFIVKPFNVFKTQRSICQVIEKRNRTK